MRKWISLTLVLLLICLVHAGAFATTATDEKRVYYPDFLSEYNAFMQELLHNKPAKGDLKKADKQGNIPFTIKGVEGTIEGLLVKDPGEEQIAAPDWKGHVNNFTITLKYHGSVFPVLAAIHALTSDEKLNGNDAFNEFFEAAYRQFNPDGLGQFEIRNYRGQIIEKSKEGLAVKVSFNYLAGIEPDPPYTAEQLALPVDLEGFVERWNFEGYTQSANILGSAVIHTKKFVPYKVKTGKADEQGLVPFVMSFQHPAAKVEIEGFTRNNLIESVKMRYTPPNSELNYITTGCIGIVKILYAMSGIENPTGLMRYRDYDVIAQHFQKEMYTAWLTFNFYRVKNGSELREGELEKLLEAKPFNGYQISTTVHEENGLIIREYSFTRTGL